MQALPFWNPVRFRRISQLPRATEMSLSSFDVTFFTEQLARPPLYEFSNAKFSLSLSLGYSFICKFNYQNFLSASIFSDYCICVAACIHTASDTDSDTLRVCLIVLFFNCSLVIIHKYAQYVHSARAPISYSPHILIARVQLRLRISACDAFYWPWQLSCVCVRARRRVARCACGSTRAVCRRPARRSGQCARTSTSASSSARTPSRANTCAPTRVHLHSSLFSTSRNCMKCGLVAAAGWLRQALHSASSVCIPLETRAHGFNHLTQSASDAGTTSDLNILVLASLSVQPACLPMMWKCVCLVARRRSSGVWCARKWSSRRSRCRSRSCWWTRCSRRRWTRVPWRRSRASCSCARSSRPTRTCSRSTSSSGAPPLFSSLLSSPSFPLLYCFPLDLITLHSYILVLSLSL